MTGSRQNAIVINATRTRRLRLLVERAAIDWELQLDAESSTARASVELPT